MKKIVTCFVMLGLSACATPTKIDNGLTRLEHEPVNCKFLYTLNTSATTYKIIDAYDYVEKSILEQEYFGDSYYISEENIADNVGPMFGPEHTYKFKVKVYNCNK